MALRAAVLVLVISSLAVEHSTSLGDDALEQRVEELEAVQENTEERLERQEDFDRKILEAFRSVINGSAEAETPPSTASLPTADATPLTLQPHASLVATPLDVRREELASGFRYTVRYLPNDLNLRVAYVVDSVVSFHQANSNDILEDGVMSVTFEKGPLPTQGYTHDYVYFMAGTQRIGVRVNREAAVEKILSTSLNFPDFTSSPHDELLYRTGENTERITVNQTGWSELYLSGTLTRGTNGEAFIFDDLRYTGLLELRYGADLGDGIFQIRLLTSTYRYRFSGYIDISVRNYIVMESDAAEIAEVKQRVYVHPDDQTGLLPVGYTEFPKRQHLNYDHDGKRLVFCDITDNGSCQAIVEVLTETSARFFCQEVTVHGEVLQELPVTTPGDLSFDRLLQSYLVTLQPRTAGQASSLVICQDITASGSTSIQEMKVIYINRSRIVMEKSSAVVHNDSSPETDGLTVTCVATGLPLPRLSVHVEMEAPGMTASYDMDGESSASGREVRATRTLSPSEISGIKGVTCSAYQFYQSDHFSTFLGGDGKIVFGEAPY